MSYAKHLWDRLRSSLWFVPSLFLFGSIAMAFLMIYIDSIVADEALEKVPFLLGAGAEGSRGMLEAIASSVITVAGVSFSITIVTLSLTSQQYTPRVLRNFMRDLGNQVVLGVFLGTFAYSLVVLRTIHGGEQPFVPALSASVGFILALVSVGFLIFFIHHVAISIQVSSIAQGAVLEALASLDERTPVRADPSKDERRGAEIEAALEPRGWSRLMAPRSGYLQSVDRNALAALARERDVVIRIDLTVGDFAIAGTPIGAVHGVDGTDPALERSIDDYLHIGSFRTFTQDLDFAIQQIVDIALRALSPGVNDTTTVVRCLDYLTALLVHLAGRQLAPRYQLEDGRLRLIVRVESFESLAELAYAEIRRNASGNFRVLARLVESIETVARQTEQAERLEVLREHLRLVSRRIEASIEAEEDRAELRRLVERAEREIARRG